VSHDADFYGTTEGATKVHERIGWGIQTFKRRKAGTPITAILTSDDELLVDIMNSVNGLSPKDFEKLATRIDFAGVSLPILSPPGLLKAKLANLSRFNQEKGNRQDLKQTKMLVPINREFLKDSIEAVHSKELPIRQSVFFLNTVYDTINYRYAQSYRQLFGERGVSVFPVEALMNSAVKSFQNFYLHRIAE